MEQHPGHTHSKNPSVETLRVRFPPLGAGGAAVREGGHTPETRVASSDMAPHHPACIYEGPVRRSGGIATPRAPVSPNHVALDHEI